MGNTRRTYLGDSVYVKEGRLKGEIVLTTNNGYYDDPRNKIIMEPRVVQALLDWLQINPDDKEKTNDGS